MLDLEMSPLLRCATQTHASGKWPTERGFAANPLPSVRGETAQDRVGAISERRRGAASPHVTTRLSHRSHARRQARPYLRGAQDPRPTSMVSHCRLRPMTQAERWPHKQPARLRYSFSMIRGLVDTESRSKSFTLNVTSTSDRISSAAHRCSASKMTPEVRPRSAQRCMATS